VVLAKVITGPCPNPPSPPVEPGSAIPPSPPLPPEYVGNASAAAAVGVATARADWKEADRIREKKTPLKATMVNNFEGIEKIEDKCSVLER
jgi:hypothetical protein